MMTSSRFSALDRRPELAIFLGSFWDCWAISVVIPKLCDQKRIALDLVDHAMLVGDPARPEA